MGHSGKQSAGRLGHIRSAFAGEAETDVVLWEHYRPHAFPVFRFVLANPKQFCEGEICQRGIAGELDEPLLTDFGGQIVALLFSAHVAPDQSGANDAPLLVQHNGAMHLPGEASASASFRSKVATGYGL